ncbi:MAG: aromatic acid exporter family protein [Peptoniphilus sp.]|nr:aromatic acid exporter family protein [Peptoniphilus sp.]MDD7363014.1 aromatic acid exporter family protein [Bacillota bacterium]MDY6045279.1 aromatic acid exporter family protein [Peptoniphilus sp.]
MKKRTPRIGMRTFKTALSVVVSLFIGNLLGLNTPLFVAIASMTTMQPSVHETHRAVRLRMFTCVMGVILGYFLSLITKNPYIRPFIAGAGIIIIILTLLRFKLNRYINLTNIIFVASFSSKQSQLIYGINRLIGTLLGIIVSVVINYLIAKPTPKRGFKELLEKTYKDIFHLSEVIILADQKPDLEGLQKELTKAQDSFELLRKEMDEPFSKDVEIEGVEKLLDLYGEIFVYLQVLLHMDLTDSKLSVENKLMIRDLFQYTSIFERVDDAVLDPTVNFHVNAVLKSLEEIQALYNEGVTHV